MEGKKRGGKNESRRKEKKDMRKLNGEKERRERMRMSKKKNEAWNKKERYTGVRKVNG